MTNIKITEQINTRKQGKLNRPAQRKRNQNRRRGLPRRRNNNNNRRRQRNTQPRQNNSPIMSLESLHFAEAMLNPFSDAAIGAILPDNWTPPTIPALDRLSLVIDPAVLQEMGDSSKGFTILGIFAMFLPRTLAQGWLAVEKSDEDDTTLEISIYKVYPITSAFTVPDDNTLCAAYSLAIGLVATDADNTSPVLFGFSPAANLWVANAVSLMSFSRHSSIEENTSALRIVSMGLKAYSNEAPLITGGTVYGGQCTPTDLAKLVYNSDIDEDAERRYMATRGERKVDMEDLFRHRTAANNRNNNNIVDGPVVPLTNHYALKNRRKFVRVPDKKTTYGTDITGANLEDILKSRHTYPAIQGTTIRYSIFQSNIQIEFQNSFDIGVIAGVPTGGSGRTANAQVAIGANDLAGAGTYCPSFYWKFNSVDGTPATYSVRIEARVHLQCEPNAVCPFQTVTPYPDPFFRHVRLVIGNVDVYPLVTKGNSFSSFMKGYNRALKAAGRTAKFLAPVARYLL
jgi:hypothetical protein